MLIDGVVYATTDSGTHWSHVPGQVGRAQSLSVVGSSLWITSATCPPCTQSIEEIQVGSTSGGVTRSDPGELLVRTGQMSATAVGGHVAGEPTNGNPLLVTTDGGGTWARRASPCPGLPLQSMAAVDATHWWLLCELGSGRNQGTVQLFQTTNAGGTWQMRDSASEQSGTIVGDLGDTIVASISAGDGGTVLWVTSITGVRSSLDGGRTWLPGPDLMGDAPRSTVSSAGTRAAWIVVEGSGLWRTTDGINWTR